MTQWTPTMADVLWCAGLLRTVKHGGIWGSTNGIYHVDHVAKRLTLTAKPPWFQQHNHDRNVVAFAVLGYEVTVDVD